MTNKTTQWSACPIIKTSYFCQMTEYGSSVTENRSYLLMNFLARFQPFQMFWLCRSLTWGHFSLYMNILFTQGNNLKNKRFIALKFRVEYKVKNLCLISNTSKKTFKVQTLNLLIISKLNLNLDVLVLITTTRKLIYLNIFSLEMYQFLLEMCWNKSVI